MLVRAYRLTDKLGMMLLKSSAALADWMLSSVSVITGALERSLGGVFRLLFSFLYLIFRLFRRLVSGLWSALRMILGFGGRVALFSTGVARRSSQQAAQAAGTTMARRAARAEMEAGLAEDPLRVQNRVLSGVTVILLAVLIGVVLWATNPARTTGSTLPDPNNTNFSFLPSTEEAAPTTSVLLNTPVPTATQLPSVLEARGSIAYTVRERGQDDIWAVGIGGSRTPLRLTNSPADDRDPVWSPDGTKVAYASRQDGNWELYIYDMLTGQTTRMTYDLSFQGAPGWSPDGQWLVYESYQGNNLDVYVVPVDGSQLAQRITENPAPDFSPAWSPDGRRIAFVSWRDGNQDIYTFSLDNPVDADAANITNTPDRQEDYPAWSPNGRLLAYSALDQGREKVFVKDTDEPGAAAQVLEQGRQPAWAPNGSSLLFAVDSIEGTQLVAGPFTENGVATLVVGVQQAASNPAWTGTPLPTALVNSGGVGLGVPQSLYVEAESLAPDGLWKLQALPDVSAPSAYLSDRVNDAFNALRRRMLDEAGWDFLGKLEDAFWVLEHSIQPGEERRNWLMTGRAFAVDRNLNLGFPSRIEMVREDIGVDTYWRLYVRADDGAQSGQLGEPLRRMPWDMLSRSSGDVQAYDQGGRLKTVVPEGYYIDFTQLAQDYGWDRLPAGNDWRANFNSVNYWLFRKPDGLNWFTAMREQYGEGELINYSPTAAPTLSLTQQP
jgi:TolB protein